MRNHRTPQRRGIRALLAAALSAVLVITGLIASPAMAASGEFIFTTGLADGASVQAGATYKAKLQFTAADNAGKTIAIDYPKELAATDGIVAELKKSQAIDPDSIVVDAVTHQISFQVLANTTMQQTLVQWDYSLTPPEESVRDVEIAWAVDGKKTTNTVTLMREGDEPSTVTRNTQSKSNGWQNTLAGAVSVSDDRTVSFTPTADNFATYTITIDAKTARTITLTDAIDPRLVIDRASVSATLTSWTDGLNKETSTPSLAVDADGNFAPFPLAADSRITITYRATINPSAVEEIRAELQAQLDSVGSDESKELRLTFGNTATPGDGVGNPVTANVGLAYQVQGVTVDYGAAFAKTSTVSGEFPIEPDAEGVLATPIPVDYTLKANLSVFAGKPDRLTPNRNVVITDNRNGQSAIEWLRGENFVTEGGVALTEASETLTDAEFEALGAGHYRVTAAGALQINVGNEAPYVDHTYVVKAQVTNIQGLRQEDYVSNPFAEKMWVIKNVAEMKFRTDSNGKITRESWFKVYTEKDTTGGIEEREAFSKSTSKETQVGADGVAWIPFTFATGWKNKYPIKGSTIVDEIDHSIFDVTEANLAAIAATATGTIANQSFRPGELDFALVDGNLEISVNDTFFTRLGWGQDSTAISVTVKIPTHAIEGRQTIDFSNTARMYGSDSSSVAWVSTSTAAATTYGAELEVRKLLYQGGGAWGANLRAEFDAEGNLVDDTFIYRVQLRPHGNYNDVSIIPVTDVLPEGVQWQGFVADSDLESKVVNAASSIYIGGGITATWGALDNGTPALILEGKINTDVTLNVNFLVKVTEWTPDVSIVNSIGAAKATITPSEGYPLVIEKQDASDPSFAISDKTARFRVDKLEADQTYTLVVDNAFLVNGNVMVAGKDGQPKAIVVPETGTYRVSEMRAPAGYEAVEVSTDGTTSNKSAKIVVTEGGSDPARIVNKRTDKPAAKSYAIGDYVWYDDNKNGVQDASERPVPNVTVALLNVDNTAVIGTDGKPVTTTTDENGKYLFDELPAGEYRVQFTLPQDVADEYEFTSVNSGDDAVIDSDANPATGISNVIVLNDDNKQLTVRDDVRATQGIDPTWDAGIIKSEKAIPLTYAIGDVTWIDTNKDGIQDSRESYIDGIIVRLLDEDGNVIDETVTKDGHYLFDELAAGTYRVEFEIPEELRTTYAFTVADAPVRGDGTTALPNDDSDAAPTLNEWIGRTGKIVLDETNTQLTTTYEREVRATAGIDPTWDAGVIVKYVSVGDYVWIDENRDGLQDEGEPGIPGVVLELLGPDGEPVLNEAGTEPLTTTTDDNGGYLFPNLPALNPGETYTVRIDPTREENVKALEGLTPTRDDQDGEKNSSTWEAESVPTLTTDGAHDPTLDFGFVRKTYAIGDYTWIDANADGQQSEGELALAGVTVELLRGGKVIATDVTDAQGRYLFDELAAGDYQVRFILTDEQAAKYVFTSSTNGAAGSDSDADIATGLSGIISLGDGNAALTKDYTYQEVTATQGIDPTWDAGVIVKKKISVSVGDYVWVDENRDGLQDEGEPGIPGVVLELLGPDGEPVLDEAGQPVTTTTDEKGGYLFPNLPALKDGEAYTVRIDPKDPKNVEALGEFTPTRDDKDGDKNSSTWEAKSVTTLTTDGAHDPTLDFGFVRETYAIGDYTWIDANADGQQSEGELALAGVTVELLQGDNVIASTVTNANGRYLFDNLLAGDYRVRFVLTAEQAELYTFTASETAEVGEDSDAEMTTGLSGIISLGAGNAELTKDYTHLPFTASEGVDPTWDAGVILKSPSPGEGGASPEPSVEPSVDPTVEPSVEPSVDPTTPTTDSSVGGVVITSSPQTTGGAGLAVTGQHAPILPLVIALLSLLLGGVLVAARRTIRH